MNNFSKSLVSFFIFLAFLFFFPELLLGFEEEGSSGAEFSSLELDFSIYRFKFSIDSACNCACNWSITTDYKSSHILNSSTKLCNLRALLLWSSSAFHASACLILYSWALTYNSLIWQIFSFFCFTCYPLCSIICWQSVRIFSILLKLHYSIFSRT